jgi:hypothetical protein
MSKGRWSLEIVTDGGAPDRYSDVYASAGDEIVIRLPDERTIPRTSGVNRLRWTVDATGVIRFVQLDDELPDVSYAAPWVPVR